MEEDHCSWKLLMPVELELQTYSVEVELFPHLPNQKCLSDQ